MAPPPGLAPITFHDLARLCAAACMPARTSTAEWVRADITARHSGCPGGGFDPVVAFTATASPLDAVADAGCGGRQETAIPVAAPLPGAALILNAGILPRQQVARAGAPDRRAGPGGFAPGPPSPRRVRPISAPACRPAAAWR